MRQIINTFVIFQRSESGNYRLFILSVALAFVSPVLNHLIGPYMYALFISNLEVQVTTHELTWQHAIGSGVLAYACITLASYIVQTALAYAVTYLENRAMQRIDNATAKHILSLSLDFFKDNFTGSLVTKQTRFSKLYENLFDMFCWEIVPTIVIIVGSLPIIFAFSWVLGIVLTTYVIGYIMLSIYMSRRLRPLQEEFTNAGTTHTGLISDQIGNIQTVKFFGRDEDELERYADWNKKKTKLRITTWLKDQNYRTLSNTLIMGINLTMIIVCYLLWAKGTIHLAGVILILTYNGRISDRIWQIGNIIKNLRTIRADASEMIQILQISPAVIDREDAIPCDIHAGHIVIKNMSFAYPDKSENVFTDFSLDIPAGQKVGIVGTSGSGKSTLVQLLMRMMDIHSGEIIIDGIPINAVRQSDLRQKICIVPQETTLFHRSVYENIAYDKYDASHEEIIEAATKAEAHEFISRLSSHGYQGYDVKVGERGIKLSGGQRQRIGLARALLQHKALLILDEATSSLDSLSEKKIQRALTNLLHEEGTMIIIAHRLSTVHQLDRIIVLDNGKIIEDGAPDELYNIQSGAYRSMIDAQQLITEGTQTPVFTGVFHIENI